MTRKRRVQRALATLLPALLLALLPPGSTAQAAAQAPHGTGETIAIALDWPDGPITPGTERVLGVRVTNIGNEGTTQPTRVVLDPPGGRIDGSALPGFQEYPGGNSVYEVPAGLLPGSTDSRQLPIRFLPDLAPRPVEHAEVNAFHGDDCATATYDVVIGDPVNNLSITARALGSAKPGEWTKVFTGLHNDGPSGGYYLSANPAMVTITLPPHTTFRNLGTDPQVGPEGCYTNDARNIATCTYPIPLPGDSVSPTQTVNVSADAPSGTTLHGTASVTAPYDPEPTHTTSFTITVP